MGEFGGGGTHMGRNCGKVISLDRMGEGPPKYL